MRYFELLPEALGNANEIVTTALDTLPVSIKQFASANTLEIIDNIGMTEEYADLQEHMRLRDAAYKKDDYRTAEQLFDRIEPIYTKIADAIDQAPYAQDITKELVHILELDLQDIARDYIEKYYGKIEPLTEPGVDRRKANHLDFDKLFDTKNLYWAEHIIVQLQLDGVGKDGVPWTNGGYFQRSASKSEISSETGRNIKWGDEPVVLINIFVDKVQIWQAILGEISNQFREDIVGEYFDEELTIGQVKSIVKTFLHEVIHFEQEIRARTNTKGKNYFQKTALPNTGIKRKSVINQDPSRSKGSPNQTSISPKYRAGRRGRYPDILNTTDDPKVWAAYLGRAIEIEAHAAHVAAQMYADIVTDRFGYGNRKMPQEDINYTIDNRIHDVKWGHFPPNNHKHMIADKAKAAAANPNRSNEDKRFIKVWNTFRKKLIQHLQSYKREIPPENNSYD